VKQLAEQDRQLGMLLAGLDARGAWPHTTLLVVSDHGMTRVGKSVPIQGALRSAKVRARVEPSSSVAHVFLEDPADLARAERALAGLEGVHVDRRDALPASLHLSHPTRTGDLVVRADPPYTFAKSGWFERAPRGMHGYAPEHPDMAGIFLAVGRGVPAGAKLGAVQMIDVAPTAARLLGIDPPRNAEGRAIAAIAQ
jgi:arylsulfatase A-like enzyme